MKRLVFVMVATAVVAGAGLAAAQSTPAQPESTQVAAPAVTPAPPPPAPPPPPPPAPKPAAASTPMAHRYTGLSGLWTKPQGDFKDLAGDGWGILIMGEQFLNPSHMVAVTSDVGYVDFGSKTKGSTKNDYSLFPIQAGIRVYPMMQKKPDSKAQIFGEGGLGFVTTRTEITTLVGSTSNYDYYFGTNAGVGVKLSSGSMASLLFDATWNWVFATGTDPNYLALRGAIMIPVGR